MKFYSFFFSWSAMEDLDHWRKNWRETTLQICYKWWPFSFRLCDDYEQIAEKALTTPSNTEHLMELKAYIEKVESDIIFTMEKRLMESKDRLTFLSDFAQFSPAEMRLNASVFKWHGRMPTIFEEHKMIVSDRRTQYEEALKVWENFFFIKKFLCF